MAIKIVQSGKELEIREALAYLERRYGIPSSDIRAVSVTGQVGEPMAITVTVYVRDGPPPAADDGLHCSICLAPIPRSGVRAHIRASHPGRHTLGWALTPRDSEPRPTGPGVTWVSGDRVAAANVAPLQHPVHSDTEPCPDGEV